MIHQWHPKSLRTAPMGKLHEDIQEMLKPNYTVQRSGAGAFMVVHFPVVGEQGVPLRNEVGALYRFTDESTWRGSVYRRQVIKTLIDLGAIEPPKKRRTNTSRDYAKTTQTATPKTGLVMAKEVLKDTNASPRERKLAREYIKLMENHQKVRDLAAKLGKRLSELNATLDRVSTSGRREGRDIDTS